MRIREWMTPAPVTVAPTSPVVRAQELMQYRRIRHLPVIDNGGRLVGIVTDRDVRSVRPSPATTLSVHEMGFLLARLKVSEVMSRNVLTIGPDEPLAEAVRLMIENRIGGLPVVEGDRVVGILTEIDLLRALSTTLGAPVGRPPRPADDGAGAASSGRSILVPLDGHSGSETVLATVGEMARAEGAAVRLLYVAPPVEAITEDDRVVVFVDQETLRVEAEAHDYFRRVVPVLGDVPVEFSVRFGEPAGEIVSEAAETRPSVIAMASHRRHGIARFVRGSVAERVERATTVPVVLVQYGESA